MFPKVTVKGSKGPAPSVRFLTSMEANPAFAGDVKWNFQKYLIDRNGKLVGVYSTKIDPMSPDFTAAIEKLL